MKTANTIFKLFIVSLVLMACSTEDPAELDSSLHQPEVELPEVSAGTFTAMIDGAEYAVDIATATLANNIITISGKRGTETITLRMPSSIGTNPVTNPNILGGANDAFAAFYNTNVTTISEATTNGDLHMTIGEGEAGVSWVADTPTVIFSGGTTQIKGVKSAPNGELNTAGEPIFVTQSVNMLLQTDIEGSYVFGATNTANYNIGGAGADVFEADTVADNGAVSLVIDDVNKLASGTFNFIGTETYTESGSPLTGTDTDGDGMLNGIESNLGYDPNNPCSPIRPEGFTGYDVTNTDWLAADCDGDSITNQDELTAGTDPYEGNTDTDGDGVSDAQEDIDDVTGGGKNDPCLPVQDQFYTEYNAVNATWMAADCDGDTITNGAELAGPDGDVLTTADNTNPYFAEFLTKTFATGSFSKVPYGVPAVKRGLNISTHDTATNKIIGTFSFISASIGEDPTRWYVVTDGTFDVTYTVPE